MLIYPFHNDDRQSQLPTRVGRVWFGRSFARRNHGGGVADRGAKQGRDSDFWVWVFLLRFRERYFKGLGLGFSASLLRSLFLRGELSLSFGGLEEEWNEQQWRKGKKEMKLERTAVEKSKTQ